MTKSWVRLAASAVAGLSITATAARADQGSLSFGGSGARSLAMAGAAVAVGDRDEAPLVNPAALAGGHGFHLGVPSFNLDSFEGPSLSDVNNKINDIANAGGGSGNTNYKSLAQLFSNRTGASTASVSAFETLGFGSFALNLLGQARVDGSQYYGLVPNSMSAVNPGGVTGVPDPSNPGSSTVYRVRAGYAIGPNIAYGSTLPRPLSTDRFGTLSAGINLKILTGRAIDRYVLVTRDANGNVTNGQRENSGTDPSSGTGVGADVGLLLKYRPNLRFGLDIQNLVPPSISGLSFQPQVTVGTAYRPMPRLLVAADIANLTGAYGQSSDLRAGVEFRPISWAALRAGVSSRGVSIGAGIHGVNLAYSFADQRIQADLLHF